MTQCVSTIIDPGGHTVGQYRWWRVPTRRQRPEPGARFKSLHVRMGEALDGVGIQVAPSLAVADHAAYFFDNV